MFKLRTTTLTQRPPTELYKSFSGADANYIVTEKDDRALININVSTAARTVTLPCCATIKPGFMVTIRRNDANVSLGLAINPNPRTTLELIDGATNNTIYAQNSYITLVNKGASWTILSAYDFLQQTNSAAGLSQSQYEVLTNVMTVPPGEWFLSGANHWLPNANCTITGPNYILIGTATGNNTTGGDLGRNFFGVVPPVTNQYVCQGAIPPWRTVLTAATTYYLKHYTSYTTTGAAMTAYCNISATRVR